MDLCGEVSDGGLRPDPGHPLSFAEPRPSLGVYRPPPPELRSPAP